MRAMRQWLLVPIGLVFVGGCSGPAADYANCKLAPASPSAITVPEGERVSPAYRRASVEAQGRANLIQCLRVQAFGFAPAEASIEQVAQAASGRCIADIQVYESLAGFRYFDFEQFNPSFSEQMAIRRVAQEEVSGMALAAAVEARASGCPKP